jgi:hypothetical protein
MAASADFIAADLGLMGSAQMHATEFTEFSLLPAVLARAFGVMRGAAYLLKSTALPLTCDRNAFLMRSALG